MGCGSGRSPLWGQPSLMPAVPLVTSHSGSLHHSFLQGCCGMERLMNKSIPLGAEAAKLRCQQKRSAGAGSLTAGVAPLVNSPHAAASELPAAKRVALIAFSPCFIYQSAQYAGSVLLSHILPGFSLLVMGAVV